MRERILAGKLIPILLLVRGGRHNMAGILDGIRVLGMSDGLTLSISLILDDHIVLRLRDLLAVLTGTSLDQVLLRRNLTRSLTLNSHRLASVENINTLAKSNVFDID